MSSRGRDAALVREAAAVDAAQVIVVDDRTVVRQELHHRVIDVQADLDLIWLDLGSSQLQDGAASGRPTVKAAGGGSTTQMADGLVVGSDPDRLPAGSWVCYAAVKNPWSSLIASSKFHDRYHSTYNTSLMSTSFLSTKYLGSLHRGLFFHHCSKEICHC